ncbi:MAG: dipeptidase PepE [Gemmatimonadota bacterium]|nr:dipeptidase PepE [Gemmatimonadota bacterium]
MADMRLLLLSNSRNYGKGYLEHAGEAIRDFLSAKVRDVLFVPYAVVRVPWDDATAMVAQRFRELGYELRSVHTAADPVAAVRGARAIAVSGGNTFHLLKTLYDTGLVDAIRAAARAGTPYMGWSAGANVAGPTIRTTNDMPIVEPPTLDALALVPFQINPHYTDATIPSHGGETRGERLLEFTAANPGKPVIGLREGSMLRLEGNRVTLLGDQPARLFLAKRDPWEVEAGGDIGFLMT